MRAVLLTQTHQITVDVYGNAWYDALRVVYLGVVQVVQMDTIHAAWAALRD